MLIKCQFGLSMKECLHGTIAHTVWGEVNTEQFLKLLSSKFLLTGNQERSCNDRILLKQPKNIQSLQPFFHVI